MPDLLTSYKSGKDKVKIEDVVDYSKGQPVETEYPVFIASKADLKNYTNEYLYQAEKALLKWLKEKSKDKHWCKYYCERTYKYSQIIENIWNRKYDRKIDQRYVLPTAQMFSHYCSATNKYYYDYATGKHCVQSSYRFSATRWRTVKPWSIRLQVEQLEKQGIFPTKDDIVRHKPLPLGRCRNPNIQTRRNKRSKRAKIAWQKRQAMK